MKYAIQVIVSLLNEKIGKRTTHQIVCVLLLVFGVKRNEIQEAIGVSRTSLWKYEKLLREEKLKELFEAELYRPVSELEKHSALIEEDFANSPPKTRSEAAERIKRLTGIERSLPNIGKFLKKRA